MSGFRLVFWAAACAGVLAGQGATIGAVLNGASYSAALSPGCWATIFGENLAAGTAAAQSVPLPRELGAVSVTVGGIAAPLLYVSPKQINFLIPYEVPLPTPFGKTAPVVVSRGGAASSAYGIQLSRVSPAIFSRDASGKGRALLFDPRFVPADPVAAGDTVIFYAAGLGPTNPPAGGEGGAPKVVTEPLEIYMGEQMLSASQVLFAGLAPGYPGIYQINVRVPEGMATDRLYMKAGGWQSNIVDFSITAGSNTANVTGSIIGLYPPAPANTPPYSIPAAPGLREGFSVMLAAAAFEVSFDIRAGAAPFAVAAVHETATAIIRIDPAAGTWQALNTEPTAAARFWDFSVGYPDLVVLDFFACDGGGNCSLVPGNRIPLARVSPVASYALRYLPGVDGNGPLTGLIQRSGRLGADGKFRVTMKGGEPISEFGGWLRLAYGPFATHASALRLYVDGRVVASREAVYETVKR